MGVLYLVGTPIGNLEDITLRALRILAEVHLVAAEDTRRARILLNHYELAPRLISYFEGNEVRRVEQLLDALGEGDVAVISEAGMPGLSDPGYGLVQAAIKAGYGVVPVPGPSAPIAAVVASGLPTDRFLFLGFFPRRRSQRRKMLEGVIDQKATLVAFEAPHRLRATLVDIAAILGNRPIALCRELTKQHEEIWRGTVAEAQAYYETEDPRGEFTLVIGGAEEAPAWSEDAVRQAMRERLQSGLSHSQAAREVSEKAGWKRREVYNLSLDMK